MGSSCSGGSCGHRPPAPQQLERFAPQQRALRNVLNQQAQQAAANPPPSAANVAPYDFAADEARAMGNLQTRTIPTIAQQFAGRNGLYSSGFNAALGGAGSELERNLAAMRSQVGLQQQGMRQQGLVADQQAYGQRLHSMLGAGMQQAYDYYVPPAPPPPQPGFWSSLGSLFGRAIPMAGGAALGGMIGGPPGAMMGLQAGAGVSSGFGNLFGQGPSQDQQAQLDPYLQQGQGPMSGLGGGYSDLVARTQARRYRLGGGGGY